MKKNAMLIVAGGSGNRMRSNLPKQFLLLRKLPILAHTLSAIEKAIPTLTLVLVLPKNHFDTWKKLVETYNISTKHAIVEGGPTRFESVKNGLDYLSNHHPNTYLVGVTDGVRPFISKYLITTLFTEWQNSIIGRVPGVAAKDSIRLIQKEHNTTIDRSSIRLIQTPQVFHFDFLFNAYSQQAFIETFTDDASVAEAYGGKIEIVKGDDFNIKITTPFDLIIAEQILANYANIHPH